MRCCGRWKTKFHRKWEKQISKVDDDGFELALPWVNA